MDCVYVVFWMMGFGFDFVWLALTNYKPRETSF